MFNSDLLPMMKNHLTICQILKAVPYEFDPKTGRLQKLKNVRHLCIFRIQCVLSVLYLTTLFLNICFEPLSLNGKFQGVTFCMLYFVASDSAKLARSLGENLMKLLIRIAETSAVVVPFLQLILLQFAPCTPPFIFSTIPNCSVTVSKINWIVRLAVHIFETWMSLQMVFGCTVNIFYVLFSGVICILFYFRIIEKSLQILEKSFNGYPMNRVVPVMVFGIPSIEIITLFVVINFYQDIALPGFLVFPLLWMNTTLCNIVAFTSASLVHTVSEKTLIALKNRMVTINLSRGRKGSIINRELKACSVLKVKFGSNYIDRGTPLVIQNFCINQTMSLTLRRRIK
ncbi:hypothetical protein Fcan01_23152 [Folsomia candida]|uniref:Uncharacterized protein n=1 Tax=Folsomia candida TaxID=158441 RepID=A0A226DA85_FOLCA|nr:hypothetical protein Fcan01_23152 [Folsomia candida]